MMNSPIDATDRGEAGASVAQEVGRRLRRVRRRRRMTLAAVASAADTSESFLSQLERGQTGASLDTLARLAHALNIGSRICSRRIRSASQRCSPPVNVRCYTSGISESRPCSPLVRVSTSRFWDATSIPAV